MDRKDLRDLSRIRLSEARALLKAGQPDGAYYLAGYAVECALKAGIAKQTQRYEFPEKKRVDASYTHNLKELVKAARLQDELRTATNADATFRRYWAIVELGSAQSRYGTSSAERAQGLIEALSDRNHGVMKWLKRYW